jgi:branched-chain amino acid transport system substrate-binding protein
LVQKQEGNNMMTKLRISRLLVLGGLMALIAAACGGTAAEPDVCASDEFGCVVIADGEPISIGSLLVTTGANSSLGLDSQYGVELALDYYGDQAFDGTNTVIAGHTVELSPEDDGCSAEGGTAGANRLAADAQIVAVVGTSCSSAALDVADQIFSDKGISIVSPSNTGPALTDPAKHKPFYLRTAHNDSIQGAAVANFAFNELGVTTAATIHDGSPYAEGLQGVFAEVFQSLGGTITTQEAVQVGQTDFNPVLTAIAASEPEFLYYPIFVAEGGLITQQARETPGLEATLFAGSDGMFTPDWIEAAGAENAEGVYISGPDLSALSGDMEFYTNTFIPAYTERNGAPQSVFHAHAWDATNMILAAIEEVGIDQDGTFYIPRTALKDALYATSDFPGITGTLSCNENGDCQPSATIAVVQVEGGAFTDAVYSELGTLGG